MSDNEPTPRAIEAAMADAVRANAQSWQAVADHMGEDIIKVRQLGQRWGISFNQVKTMVSRGEL